MQYRKVTAEEYEQLLGGHRPAGSAYDAYQDVLSGLADGDVVSVTIEDASAQREERIRFARAARQMGRSLTWLRGTTENEIVFQIGPLKHKRTREQREEAALAPHATPLSHVRRALTLLEQPEEQLSDTLREIVVLGQIVYTRAGFLRFLTTQLPVFGGRTALDLIEEGEDYRVLAALAADYEGIGT